MGLRTCRSLALIFASTNRLWGTRTTTQSQLITVLAGCRVSTCVSRLSSLWVSRYRRVTRRATNRAGCVYGNSRWRQKWTLSLSLAGRILDGVGVDVECRCGVPKCGFWNAAFHSDQESMGLVAWPLVTILPSRPFCGSWRTLTDVPERSARLCPQRSPPRPHP
jgi:hypothetical protein